MTIKNKIILIFGGTGSIGKKFIKKNIIQNKIINISRNYEKQKELENEINNKNLINKLADINDIEKIIKILNENKPNIILICSANKYIDHCEKYPSECLQTNLISIKQILDEILKNKDFYNKFVEAICFISSNRSCNPINMYGYSKAFAENLMIEKSKEIPQIKFTSIRFGNVLGSDGSLIPTLHKLGRDSNIMNYKITNQYITRFILTLDEASELIEYSIMAAESGDIIIGKIKSIKLIHLLQIFSEIYNKEIINLTDSHKIEKITEITINEDEGKKTIIDKNGNYIIKLSNSNEKINKEITSNINLLSKEELKKLLFESKLV